MNVAVLRAIYDELWRHGRLALSAGLVEVDPLPVDGGSRWGISAVLRPRVWSDALDRCAADVAALAGPRAVAYATDNLHVTVQQFEGHRSRVPMDDPAVAGLSSALAVFARDLPPLAFASRGLTATSGGVFVQGWPDFDLQALRARLHRAMRDAGVPVQGPEASSSALRTSAHATLAIFGGPLADAGGLIAYVDAHRETDFGTIAFDELWLVGYARTERSVRLIEYGRFPVGGPAGSSR